MQRVYDVDWPAEQRLTRAIRGVVNRLHGAGWVRGPAPDGPAFEEAFERLQRCAVPATAFTPAMCRLIYELTYATRPARVVGLGTYYGSALNLMAAAATRSYRDWFAHVCERVGLAFPVDVIGADTDPDAVAGAVRNGQRMVDGAVEKLPIEHTYDLLTPRLGYVHADAAAYLRARAARKDRWGAGIDLLYLDVDDPVTGKALYADLFDEALPLLTGRAVVLAHDATVPRFRGDLDRLRGRLRANGFRTLDVPVDRAGLLVAARTRATD